jgi:hypothetical protein
MSATITHFAEIVVVSETITDGQTIDGCRRQRFLTKPSARRTNRTISSNARKLLIAHRKFDDSRRWVLVHLRTTRHYFAF